MDCIGKSEEFINHRINYAPIFGFLVFSIPITLLYFFTNNKICRPIITFTYTQKHEDCGVWSEHRIYNDWSTMWVIAYIIITLGVLCYLGFAFYKSLMKYTEMVKCGLIMVKFLKKLRIRLILYIIALGVAYLLPLANKFIARAASSNSTILCITSYSGTIMFYITGVFTFIMYSLNTDAWTAVKKLICCDKNEDEEKPGSAVRIREKSITHEMLLSVLEYREGSQNSDG